MKIVKAFFQFWYDFIIGDDWKIAAAVLTVLLAGALVVLAGPGNAAILTPLIAVGLGAAFAVSVLIDVNLYRRELTVPRRVPGRPSTGLKPPPR